MWIVLVMIGLCAIREFGVEALLKVDFEDAHFVIIEKKYFDADKSHVDIIEDEETGETTVSTTLSIIKTLPLGTRSRFMLLGLSMGEYTIPTGIDINMPMCESLDDPIIMGPFFAELGFTKDACPPPPAIYSQEAYKLPVDVLPDEFVENKYLVNIEIIVQGKPVIRVHIYLYIQTA